MMRWEVEPPLSIIVSQVTLLLFQQREHCIRFKLAPFFSTNAAQRGKHEKTYMRSKRPSIRVPNRPPMVFAGDPLAILLPRRKLKLCLGYTAAPLNLTIPKLVSSTAPLPLSDGDRRHGA